MRRRSSSACSQKHDLGVGQLGCLSAPGCWSWFHPSSWYPSFQFLSFHTSYWKSCNLLQTSIFFLHSLQPNLYVHCDEGTSGNSKPNLQSGFGFSSTMNFGWVFCFTWISSRAQGSSFWWVTACSLHWSKLPVRDLDWQEDVWRFSQIKVMICLSVKRLSRQPGFVCTKQGQGSV